MIYGCNSKWPVIAINKLVHLIKAELEQVCGIKILIMNLVIQAIKCVSREKIVVLIFAIVTQSNVYGSLSKFVD